MRNILVVSGTRADYGKLKSIASRLEDDSDYMVTFFATGMHVSREHGNTIEEIIKDGFKVFPFNNNLGKSTSVNLSRTVEGLSLYVENHPVDLILVHGDRPDALAGAIVGVLNNKLVGHIEGGEVSGTVDELLRHSISKLSHFHFVANEQAKNRILQLGEKDSKIYVIGSPDIDIMLNSELPDIATVKARYGITFKDYAILIFHPVTTMSHLSGSWISDIIKALRRSSTNVICIQPNNDLGSSAIYDAIHKWNSEDDNVVVFPSLRFEYFLTLLREAKFIIGNSSSGIREAPYYGTPTINVGDRQYNRSLNKNIIHCAPKMEELLKAINLAESKRNARFMEFGEGDSSKLFMKAIKSKDFWETSPQKYFNDLI